MGNVMFKVAGRTFSFNIQKKEMLRKVLFVLSFLLFIYSILMLSITLLGYYKNYKLNEEIRKIYYSTGDQDELAENDRSISYSNTEPDDSTSSIQPSSQSSGQDAYISPEEGSRKTATSSVYPGYAIPPEYHMLNENKIKTPDEILLERYSSIKSINEDAVGWIQVPGTNIDYPVVQYKDNKYYLKRDFLRKWSKNGSIFADYRNNMETDRNIILYGHNMKNDSMFAQLMKYKDEEFFNTNRVINFDIAGKHYEWEIFSVYITDTKFNYLITSFDNQNRFAEYISTIIDKSLFKNKIDINEKDRILTLSTCSYEFEDARMVVHARLIK